MKVEYLNPAELFRSPAFSQAVVVTQPGRTIYVGGQNGVDSTGAVVGGLQKQTAQALENVRLALADAGAELTDVISWSVAIIAGEDLLVGFSAIQPAISREDPPIVNVLQVAGLAVPGALIELTAIAVLP